MSLLTEHPAGAFCWPELCSGDAAGSKAFYSSLLGWEPNDLTMPEGNYTVFKLGGHSVGAMYQMAEARKKAGVVPHWNSYVAVTNADEIAKTAAALGGKVLTQPFDAGGDRMANLQDPAGVKFSIWQAKKQPEPTRINEVGALCWCELYTPNAGKAAAFYSGLFGWRPEPWDGGPMPYTAFNLANEDRPIGGMIAMTKDMECMAPQWLPYFQVADADKTVERIRQLKGTVFDGPIDIPSVGRMAMATDQQGAGFAIITRH